MIVDTLGVALPAFVWFFPAAAILYFRVWPAVRSREATRWSIISPFVSVVIPLTVIVGIIYKYDLLEVDVLLMFVVTFAVELVMFWWAINERDRLATPADVNEAHP